MMFEFIALIQCWRNNSDTDDTFILNLASANQISQEQIEAFKKDPLLFNISGEKGFLIGACEFTKDKDLGEINHLYGLYLAFQGNDTLYILYDNCDYFCCRKCNIQKSTHDAVIRLLQKQGPHSKAQFIVNAVLHYVNCTETSDISLA